MHVNRFTNMVLDQPNPLKTVDFLEGQIVAEIVETDAQGMPDHIRILALKFIDQVYQPGPDAFPFGADLATQDRDC